MAYTLPTPTTLKDRLPEFASVTDSRIQTFLDEAARDVDTTWTEEDYTLAITMLAAHNMVQEGVIGGADPKTAQSGPISQHSLGDESTSYAVPTQTEGSLDSDLKLTVYGRRFLKLRRVNVPAALATTSKAVLRP